MDIVLTKNQAEAIGLIEAWYKSNDNQVFILSGHAGTGKSTVITKVSEKLGLKENEVTYATLSGKAAVVLNTKGIKAQTIHSMIYYKVEDEVGSRILRFEKRRFLEHPYKLIIIDEFSMVSQKIYEDLLSYGVKILVVGDKAQLPPVGDSTGLLLNPDYHMSEILRQNADSPILKLSQMILNGVELKLGTIGDKVYICKRDRITDDLLLKADQVLCGQNKTRHDLNARMRAARGETDMFPVEGDKVICIKNNWYKYASGVPIINGLIGYCKKVKHTSETGMRVEFTPDFADESAILDISKRPFLDKKNPFEEEGSNLDVDYIDYGYAITVHKAQGSEYDNVIVYKDWMPEKMRKQWIYTAVTRAKNKIVIGI